MDSAHLTARNAATSAPRRRACHCGRFPATGWCWPARNSPPDRTGSLIDRHNDPLRGGGSPEFWAAIEAFLRPFGLTTEASPIDVFPRLDTRLPRSEVYRPLRSLTIHGPNWTGRDTLEGLIIEVHTDGVDTVQRLVDEPGTTPSAGAASRSYRGLLGWHRVPLIDRASRLGSGIAIREDARALPSTSVPPPPVPAISIGAPVRWSTASSAGSPSAHSTRRTTDEYCRSCATAAN